MYSRAMRKPDGRGLTLYGRFPFDVVGPVPSPSTEHVRASPHMRFHPLRGEWVTYAPHRQDRTFLPSAADDPLRPTTDRARPTEVPQGDWDVAVFDNRFPSFDADATSAPTCTVPTRPARGKCEVVVFTQEASSSLGALPLDHLELVLRVWGDRTEVLGRSEDIVYVLPFENRGVEMGVTLHHPHGQIYAYPVEPPLPARMRALAHAHFDAHGRTSMQDFVAGELEDGRRMLYAGDHAVAFVPVCARYPYETWITTRVACPRLDALDDASIADLARAMKTVLLKYDGLWSRPMPYLMAWYQAPTDGRPHPECHLHAEIWPPYRNRDRLKYLAGTELAAGLFAMDVTPEATARELADVAVSLG